MHHLDHIAMANQTDIHFFSDPARKIAFLAGVAQANDIHPANLLIKWKGRDALIGREHDDMEGFIEELGRFVYGPLGPKKDMVEEAKRGWRVMLGLEGRGVEWETDM